MKRKIFITIALIVFISALGSLIAYRIGVYSGERNLMKIPPACIINESKNKPENLDFSIFWEGWHQLENNYLDKENIDYKKMVYGALKGMVASVGDPYTSFFSPTEAKQFSEELSGQYEGVGMIIGYKESQITVMSPFKGSPAEKAGIKAGDKIFKIDDKFTVDLTVEEAARLIKGPRNSEVKILIERKNSADPKEFKIKRELVKIPTLETELKGNDITLIKIYQFNEILPAELQKAALEIVGSSRKKIIVDLRNNPGGYLEVARDVASWFIEKNEVVVWQDIRSGDKGKIAYKSTGPAIFKNYPIVVLINEGSASASEILAGALRDKNHSLLIGQKSFGKGSVQEQIYLSDNSSLKVTIAKWLTPNGTLIDESGLEPDIKVEQKEDENTDLQLEKAVEYLEDLK